MVDNRNFMYSIEKVSKVHQRTSWKCRSKFLLKCKARATTIGNCIVKFTNEHNHSPETQQKQFSDDDSKDIFCIE